MIGSILVASVLALQAAPTAKPAAPIAVVADAGPSVEVPADLAALTGPDTIAVLYLPDAGEVEKVNERLVETMGPIGQGMPLAASVKQMLKQAVRTDLEIPMNQPVLWWIDMPVTTGDEPPMGMGEVVFHQAMRIPGAEAAMAKARAEGEAAKAADPKARPVMPVRARSRGSSVTVLKGDLVVVSSDREPFEVAASPRPSELLKSLPTGFASGRVDLSRLMAEQGDQLRMLGGFASMGLMGGMEDGPADELDDTQKRQRAMRQQMADAVGKQIDSVVDALMQLKRATFAAAMQGDDFTVWADWSREAAFPKGLSAASAQALAAALPRGMPVYFGLSSNAMATIYDERISIDDTVATLGATPEQAKAYEAAVAKAREALDQVVDGVVGGVSMEGQAFAGVAAFKVKDAAAFRGALKSSLEGMHRSGMAEITVTEAGDALAMSIAPNAVRVQELMGLLAPGAEDAEAVKQATVPTRISLRFKGNEVLATQHRGEKPVDPATMAREGGDDLRAGLGSKAWGTADWFGVIDLRPFFADAIVRTEAVIAEAAPDAADPKRAEAAKAVAAGRPMLIRLWQGVQGGTTRLTIGLNVADWKKLVEDVEAARKTAGVDDEDDAEDDDDAKGDASDEPM